MVRISHHAGVTVKSRSKRVSGESDMGHIGEDVYAYFTSVTMATAAPSHFLFWYVALKHGRAPHSTDRANTVEGSAEA